jgi:hypothetical protein
MIRTLPLLACLWAALCSTAGAQFATGQKEAALRKMIPIAEYRDNPRLLIYTEDEMPRAYQHTSVGMRDATFHWCLYNISGDAPERAKGHGNGGNGNQEPPWRNPGGMDHCSNFKTFKFLLLPEGQAVAWYMTDAAHSDGVGGIYAWIFPVGTVLGEVLSIRSPDGYDYPFEMRVRIRMIDEWGVDVFRPCQTAKETARLIESLRPNWKSDAQLSALMAHMGNARTLEAAYFNDKEHRTRMSINVVAQVDELPEMPDDLVKQLLKQPFKSTAGEVWKGNHCFAPTTKDRFSIVPAGYEGTFLGSDSVSCKSCHESASVHVDTFDAPRQWYGRIRGSDQILSFHPARRECISTNGAPVAVQMHHIPGVIEPYDPRKHPAASYRKLKG